MFIKIGNWSLAVGIEWSMPRSDAEIKFAKREHAGGHYVLDAVLQEKWLGFHEKPEGKTYAAALLIGQLESNCVVRVALNDRHCWVCSILNGKPIVGRDNIVLHSDAYDLARDWSSVGQDTVLITDVPNDGKSISDVVAVLDEAVRSKQVTSKQLSSALLRPTTFSLSTPAIKYSVAACAVASIGWIAYTQHWFDLGVAPRVAAPQAAQATQVQLLAQGVVEIEARKQKARDQLRTDVSAAQSKFRERTDPVQLWSQVTIIRSQVPISYLGYKPQTLNCDNQACILTWLGGGRFTLMSDKARLPYADQNLTPDFAATSTIPLGVPTMALPTMDGMTKEEFEFSLASAVALRGTSLRLEPMTAIMVTPAAQSQMQPVAAAYVGKWHAQFTSSQAVLDAADLILFVSKMPMRLTAIRHSQTSHSFELDGDYAFIPTSEN